MDEIWIVDHPTKGTQAFGCGAAAAHYADGQRVRHWFRERDWREITDQETVRRRGRRR